MKTYKVQWREARNPAESRIYGWEDIPHEEWSLEEHANLRMKSYWEKLGFPFEFRVTEVVPE